MGKKYAYVARAIDDPIVPPIDPPDPGNPPPPGESIPGAEDYVYFARCFHTSPYTITVETIGASNAQVVVGSSAADRQISSPGATHVFSVAAGAQDVWVYVDSSPIVGVTSLQVDDSHVESVGNLDLFPLLTSASFHSNPGLTSFDASNSTSLTSVPNLSGSKAALDDYDLSGCTSLTVANISDVTGTIDLSDCTSLDNSNITDGGGSVSFNGCSLLDDLFVDDQAETSFDLTGCVALRAVRITSSNIAVINLSAAVNLDRFTTSSLPSTTSLVLPPSLTYLSLGSVVFSDFNFTPMTSLKTLYVSGICPSWTSLDVSGLTALETVNVNMNYAATTGFTSMDLSGCTALTTLTMYRIKTLVTLDGSGCTSLTTIAVNGGNEWINFTALESIDFSGCTSLAEFDIFDFYDYSPNIDTINLSGCTSMTTVSLENLGDLVTLDVSGCTLLDDLRIYDSALTSFDVSGCYALESVSLAYVYFTSLDLSDRTSLTSLSLGYMEAVESIDLSGCTALLAFNLSFPVATALTSVDLTNCSVMTTMSIQDADLLNSLNLTGCSSVTNLTIRGGLLTSLNLSAMNSSLEDMNLDGLALLPSLGFASLTAMWRFFLSNMAATSMDVGGCASLDYAYLYNMTGFNNTDRDNLLIDLVDNGLSNGYVRLNGSLDAAGSTAKGTLESRGWSINTF